MRRGFSNEQMFYSPKENEKLRKMMLINPEKRSFSDLNYIAKIVERSKFLNEFRNDPNFLKMCTELTFQTFPKEWVIFEQGEHGDTFYIIVKGSVGVFIKKPSEFQNFHHMKMVATLEEGNSFGELALLYNPVRSATIKTLEETDIIMLNREIFEKYIKQKKSAHYEEIENFYNEIGLFDSLPGKEHLVKKLAIKSNIKSYNPKTTIVMQGQQEDFLYFLKKGSIKVYRKINFKVGDYFEPNGSELDPSETELAQGKYIELTLGIDELHKGSVFGSSQIDDVIPMSFTAISSTNCICVVVSKYDIEYMEDKLIKQRLIDCNNSYPEDIFIRQTYFEKNRWDRYKKGFLENFYRTITNEKRVEHLPENRLPLIPMMKKIPYQPSGLTVPKKVDVPKLDLKKISTMPVRKKIKQPSPSFDLKKPLNQVKARESLFHVKIDVETEINLIRTNRLFHVRGSIRQSRLLLPESLNFKEVKKENNLPKFIESWKEVLTDRGSKRVGPIINSSRSEVMFLTNRIE